MQKYHAQLIIIRCVHEISYRIMLLQEWVLSMKNHAEFMQHLNTFQTTQVHESVKISWSCV